MSRGTVSAIANGHRGLYGKDADGGRADHTAHITAHAVPALRLPCVPAVPHLPTRKIKYNHHERH